jgi:predicted transcriptional regulator
MAFPVERLQKSRLTCTDVVQCAYDLGEQDVRTYEAVNDLGRVRTEEIAKDVGKEASVVYQSLQRLVTCGIVTKRKHAIVEGGYYFVYEALPKREVKARLRACVDDWHAQMTRAIERI